MEKGNQIGMLIMTAVALIVGLILLTASAQQIGTVTDTNVLSNQSLGTMTNGTSLYITNCRALSNAIIFNATGDKTIPSTNYTLTDNVVYNGALAVEVAPAIDAGGRTLGYDKGTATIDGICQPTTYDTSSGGRALAGVIIIMFGIALAVVALYPTMRQQFS